MKRLYSILFVMVLAVNAVFAGLWPKVDEPNSPDASMLLLQFSIDERGELTPFLNANWSMITPVVKMEDGTLVEFKIFNGGADMTTIYYKENLKAGKYTLVGFKHVYTNFGKLDKYKMDTGDKKHMVPKDAYDDMPYRERQMFELDKPIEFTLEANKIKTLGHYVLKYRKGNGGAKGTTDHRYKMTRAELMMADAEDESLYNYIKPWATKKWKLWNAKNPANM